MSSTWHVNIVANDFVELINDVGQRMVFHRHADDGLWEQSFVG